MNVQWSCSKADSDKSLQRPRKFKDGAKIRKKNDQGIAEYDVTVVSAEYDKVAHKWIYTLNDCDGNPIDGKTAETRLTV